MPRTMQTTTPITPVEQKRQSLLRKKLWFALSPAAERQAAALAKSLYRIAGGTLQVDPPCGQPIDSRPGLPGNKMRRATDAEAHRMGVWFTDYFNLDCRKADFLSQTAGRLREHIAELAEIADRIDAAAKRRQRVTRARRAAG
jgi:hypothetical protein